MKLLIPVFREEDHSYWVNGKPAPGVTDTIQRVLGGNPFWTKEGRDFGSAMHLTIRYFAQKDLDLASVDARIRPRLDAYVRFCQDMNFLPDLIEQAAYRESPLYCGTFDQAQTNRAIVDFKAGKIPPEAAIQLAAYAHLLPNPLMYERWAVQLKEDGKYSLISYRKQDMTSDYNVFISMLNINSWRNRNGSSRNTGPAGERAVA